MAQLSKHFQAQLWLLIRAYCEKLWARIHHHKRIFFQFFSNFLCDDACNAVVFVGNFHNLLIFAWLKKNKKFKGVIHEVLSSTAGLRKIGAKNLSCLFSYIWSLASSIGFFSYGEWTELNYISDPALKHLLERLPSIALCGWEPSTVKMYTRLFFQWSAWAKSYSLSILPA